MELLQLKYFCEAAKYENFSKVAKKYFVPTSNISQSVKRLEAELGCPLFEHKSNKIILNSEGRRFFERVSPAVFEIFSAKEELSQRKTDIFGDIRLVCVSNRGNVTEAVERFIKKYDKVNFIISHTQKGPYDFDIFISDDCPYEYGKRIPFIEEEIGIAVSPDSPIAKMKSVCVRDLKDEKFITMTDGWSLNKITKNACADAGFSPNITIQTDDPYYLRKYVGMGLGIAFVPRSSWYGLFEKEVVIKRVVGLRRKTFAYLPKGEVPKRAAVEFLKTLTGKDI